MDSGLYIAREGDDTFVIRCGHFTHAIVLTDELLAQPVQVVLDVLVGEANKVIERATQERVVTIREAAARLRVCAATLRAWEAKGLIDPIRTPGRHRRYRLSQLQQLQHVLKGDERT